MHYFRLIHIVFVALHFGLDDFIHEHAPLKPLRKLIRLLFFWRNKQQARGERLRLALEKLGPIFVKFGQMLSTRRDLLPPDVADELANCKIKYRRLLFPKYKQA